MHMKPILYLALFLAALLCPQRMMAGGHSEQRTFADTLHTPTGNIIGRLALPANGTKAVDVVLIIAGSGPTDMNGNNPAGVGSNSYLMLSNFLTQQGYGCLTYDKRGIASSRLAGADEEKLRFDNYVADAAAWIARLKADKRVGEVIVMGHSEGSLIGMIAAERQKGVKAFISLCGTARPASDLIMEQMAAQPLFVKEKVKGICDSLRMGREPGDIPPYLNALFRKSVLPYMASWFRYDPCAEMAKLRIPALIVGGKHDIQVPAKDAQMLHAACKQAEMVVCDSMSHVLKDCPSLSPLEQREVYSDGTKPLSNQLLKALVSFLDKLKP